MRLPLCEACAPGQPPPPFTPYAGGSDRTGGAAGTLPRGCYPLDDWSSPGRWQTCRKNRPCRGKAGGKAWEMSWAPPGSRGDLAAMPRPASGIAKTRWSSLCLDGILPSPCPPPHTLSHPWVNGAPMLFPVPTKGPDHLVFLKCFLLHRLK